LLKKIILLLVIIVTGLLIGYYSETIYSFIWPDNGYLTAGEKQGKDKGSVPESNFITGEEAVDRVKNLPYLRNLARVSELDETQLSFETDREPSEDYPIWLILVKERHPDKIPDISYYQVDAVSGNVLNLDEESLKIEGAGLGMTRQEARDIIGKPKNTKRAYDQVLKEYFRTDTYQGMIIIYDGDNKIVKITVSEPGISGLGRVEVADSRKDVIKKLGISRIARIDALIYNPIGNKEIEYLVAFDSEDRVKEITVQSVLTDNR